MFLVLLLALSVTFSDSLNHSHQMFSKTGDHSGNLVSTGSSKDAIISVPPEIKSDHESTFPAGYKAGIIASFNVSFISDSERNTSRCISSNQRKIFEIIPVRVWKQFFLLASLHSDDVPAKS